MHTRQDSRRCWRCHRLADLTAALHERRDDRAHGDTDIVGFKHTRTGPLFNKLRVALSPANQLRVQLPRVLLAAASPHPTEHSNDDAPSQVTCPGLRARRSDLCSAPHLSMSRCDHLRPSMVSCQPIDLLPSVRSLGGAAGVSQGQGPASSDNCPPGVRGALRRVNARWTESSTWSRYLVLPTAENRADATHARTGGIATPAVLVQAASCRSARSARLPVRCAGLGQPGNGFLKVLDRRPHLACVPGWPVVPDG